MTSVAGVVVTAVLTDELVLVVMSDVVLDQICCGSDVTSRWLVVGTFSHDIGTSGRRERSPVPWSPMEASPFESTVTALLTIEAKSITS